MLNASPRNLLLPLLSPSQYDHCGEANPWIYVCRDGIGRYRGNIHHQRGTLAGLLQLTRGEIPTLESLHPPRHSSVWPGPSRDI